MKHEFRGSSPEHGGYCGYAVTLDRAVKCDLFFCLSHFENGIELHLPYLQIGSEL